MSLLLPPHQTRGAEKGDILNKRSQPRRQVIQILHQRALPLDFLPNILTHVRRQDTRSTRQSAYSANGCKKRSTWPPKTGRSRTNSAAKRLQEPSRMIRSVASEATRSISVSVQIPVAVDPLAEAEVADAFTAALFVKDGDQLFKGPASHVTQPLVGVGDQLIDRGETAGAI
jgi:hypothetical protein